MATSPIYGWLEPDNTDLVKNGALAIRTLGNAIDTTMGTMTPKSIVDAKGDLIAASANDTPARLAVGSNGETLVADSSTSTGLRYTAGTVQANPFLNSAMQNWQRGTSISLAASNTLYTADRWCIQSQTNQALTVTRQSTSDTTNLPFIQYCMRLQRNSGQTGVLPILQTQSFETINSIPFAGKTVTVSYYARAGANYSASGNALASNLIWGTGTDQNVTGTYTGFAVAGSATATLTTTWQRFSYSATIPSTATEIGLYNQFTPTGTASTNDYYESTGFQIDIGSVALPFRTYAGTIQGELAACQRYFWREYGGTNSPTIPVSYTANSATIGGNNPVTMRVAPSVTADYQNANYGSTWGLVQPTRAFCTKTGSASNNYFATPNTWAICFDGGTFSPTPTAFQGSASSYIQASAEL